MPPEIVSEQLSGRTAVLHDAARIDRELRVGDPDRMQIVHQHRDAFGIDERRDPADVFDTDLVELAAASGRRAFAAEHRPVIVDPLLDAVHDIGARQRTHDARRALGAQRQAPAATVLEGIHLLLNHFRLVPEALLKHFGVLENGGPELTVTVSGKDRRSGVFQIPPAARLVRENVRRTGRGGKGRHFKNSQFQP